MFSGTVKLGDLNDYIAPSQACVVALQGGKIAPGQDDAGPAPTAAAAAPNDGDGDGVVLQRRRAPRPPPKKQRPPPAPPAPAPAAPPGGGAGGFQQTYTDPSGAGTAVRVTLHDCLACSGCVTSAETVLLQQQSAAELLARLAQRGRYAVVVSVSPQSRASLAAVHGLRSAADAHLRLATFFKERLGARAVLDLGVAREVALLEAAEEFCRRYAAAPGGRLAGAAARLRAAGAARAAAAVEAALSRYAGGGEGSGQAASTAPPLPVLTSACPGWVCYAEKQQGGSGAAGALAHLSSARSPQGVMGALVKRGAAWRWSCPKEAEEEAEEGGGAGGPKKVYHVTVMPCYDKKLEAARDELAVAGGGGGGESGGGDDGGGSAAAAAPLEPEVDCCLATSELQALLEAHGCPDLAAVEPAAELDTLDGRTLPAAAFWLATGATGDGGGGGASGGVDQPPLHDPSWGRPGLLPGSGGWAVFVMRYAARRLFGLDLSEEAVAAAALAVAASASNPPISSPPLPPLAPRRLRNADMHELSLELRHALEAEGLPVSPDLPSDPPLLRFAAAYGFRNIQAVVRRLPGKGAPPPQQKMGAAAAEDGDGNGAAALAQAPPAGSYYDFVEVMACPSGCLNGGGQMSAAKAIMESGATKGAAGAGAPAAAAAAGGGGGAPKSAAAASLDELENYFAGANGSEVAMDVDGAASSWEPGTSAAVRRIYQQLELGGGTGGDLAAAAAAAAAAPGSAAARAAFHTTFRRREKTLASAVGDW